MVGIGQSPTGRRASEDYWGLYSKLWEWGRDTLVFRDHSDHREVPLPTGGQQGLLLELSPPDVAPNCLMGAHCT